MLNTLLVNTVVRYGLQQCKSGQCVFRTLNGDTVTLMVAVHVNDLFVVGSAKGVPQLHDALIEEYPASRSGNCPGTHRMRV